MNLCFPIEGVARITFVQSSDLTILEVKLKNNN